MAGINFFELIGSGGKAGARERFEGLIAQLVRLHVGESAMRVDARAGDWGLDTFVGQLENGAIEAFQAKFFIDGVGPPQQEQIRRSFAAAVAAQARGHRLTAWTLCIPVCLEAKSAKWWSGWKTRSEAEFGVHIALWDATTLEALLLDDSASYIRRGYFRGSNVLDASRRRQDAHIAQVREIAPAILHDRSEEIRQLATFAAGDESYLHVVGPAWAGKTALTSSFALAPPAGVDVASFFVTAGLTGRNDSEGFVEVLSGQLAALADEPVPMTVSSPALADAEYRRLLERAAVQANRRGRRLLLVVDGLDEDESLRPRRSLPSIASLLPRTPIPGLAVLVTSRPHPGIPIDVSDDHPLRSARRWSCEPSASATELGRAAENELMGHLEQEREASNVISCLCAVGDGLSLTELAELTGLARYEIRRLTTRTFGRSLVIRAIIEGEEPVFAFAHAALRELGYKLVADRLALWHQRIDDWADQYGAAGWPESTPRYLIWSYGRHLIDRREVNRLHQLATDARRADLLAIRTGGDGKALEELLASQAMLREEGSHDLSAFARLAVHRTRLQRRSAAVPRSLVALWAILGDIDRAERTASAMSGHDRGAALESAVVGLAELERWSEAESLVISAPQYCRDALALKLIEALIGAGNLDVADRVSTQIIGERERTAVFGLMANERFEAHAAGNDWAACEAEARSAADESLQLRLLVRLAAFLALTDPDRAGALAKEVQGILGANVTAFTGRRPYAELAPLLVEIFLRTGDVDGAAQAVLKAPNGREVVASVVRSLAKERGAVSAWLEILRASADDRVREEALLALIAEARTPERSALLVELEQSLVREGQNPRHQAASQIAEIAPDLAIALLMKDIESASTVDPCSEAARLAMAAVEWLPASPVRTLGEVMRVHAVTTLRQQGWCSPHPRQVAQPTLMEAAMNVARALSADVREPLLEKLVEMCTAGRDWQMLRDVLTWQNLLGGRPTRKYRFTDVDGSVVLRDMVRGEVLHAAMSSSGNSITETRRVVDVEVAIAQAQQCAEWLDTSEPDGFLGDMALALNAFGAPMTEERMIVYACRARWVECEQEALSARTLWRRHELLAKMCSWCALGRHWEIAVSILVRLGTGDTASRVRAELSRGFAVAQDFERAELMAAELHGIQRSQALAVITVEAAVAGDKESARRLLGELSDDYERGDALARMAVAVGDAHDSSWADEACSLGMTLSGGLFPVRLLSTLASARFGKQPPAGLEPLLERATDLAAELSDGNKRASALARLALASAALKSERAAEILERAIPNLVHADPSDAVDVVALLAGLGRWDEAKGVAGSLQAGVQTRAFDRLARIATRENLQVAHLSAATPPTPAETLRHFWRSRDHDTAGVVTVVKALARRTRYDDAARLLAAHPFGVAAAISLVSLPDRELEPLVAVAITMVESLPDFERSRANEKLARALISGGRLGLAEGILLGLQEPYTRDKLAIELSAKFISVGRAEEALRLVHEVLAVSDFYAEDVATMLSQAGLPVEAAKIWQGRGPSRNAKGESVIARQLARIGQFKAAEQIVANVTSSKDRAAARAALGLEVAETALEMAQRLALESAADSVDREPLTEVIQRVTLALPQSTLRDQLVDLAADQSTLSATPTLTALLFRRGHHQAAAHQFGRWMFTRQFEDHAKAVAVSELPFAIADPKASVVGLTRLAKAKCTPERAARAMCIFARILASPGGSPQAARLLVDYSIETIRDVPPARSTDLLLDAAEAIVDTEAALAMDLLGQVDGVLRAEVEGTNRRWTIKRLIGATARAKGSSEAESLLASYPPVDRGLAFVGLAEYALKNDPANRTRYVGMAQRFADDAANATEASEILTLLGLTVSADDPWRARQLASSAIHNDEDWSSMTSVAVELFRLGRLNDAWATIGEIPTPMNEDYQIHLVGVIGELAEAGEWQRAEETAQSAECQRQLMRLLAQAGRWKDVTRIGEQLSKPVLDDTLQMEIARFSHAVGGPTPQVREAAHLQSVAKLCNDRWAEWIWLLDNVDPQIGVSAGSEVIRIARATDGTRMRDAHIDPALG